MSKRSPDTKDLLRRTAAHWARAETELTQQRAEIGRLEADNKRLRGDLAVAIDIFHEAGQTSGWHHSRDDDVADLLARYWPTDKATDAADVADAHTAALRGEGGSDERSE